MIGDIRFLSFRVKKPEISSLEDSFHLYHSQKCILTGLRGEWGKKCPRTKILDFVSKTVLRYKLTKDSSSDNGVFVLEDGFKI